MKYIIYLFYRYYNKGATIRIPYESAIFAVLLLLFINVMSLMILLVPNLMETLFANHTRTELYVYSAIGVLLGYFMLTKLVSKDEIYQIENTSINVKLHTWLLFLYFIASFILLMAIIIQKL